MWKKQSRVREIGSSGGGTVTILNRMIRVDLTEKVAFDKYLKELCIARRAFQAEVTASAKALRPAKEVSKLGGGLEGGRRWDPLQDLIKLSKLQTEGAAMAGFSDSSD